MKNSFSFHIKEEGKIVRKLPTTSDMRFLHDEKYRFQRDLFTLASSTFILEKYVKKNYKISEVSIPISKKTYDEIKVEKIEKALENLILDILLCDIKISLKPEKIIFSKIKKKFNFDKIDTICLFSGGVDSFSGLLNAKQKFKNLCPVFIAHSDQQGMINIVNKLNTNYFSKKGLKIKKIYAPPITKGGYSQFRGFLYYMLAAMYSTLTDSNTLIISECGPTMYQPRFSPIDEVTFTTHPTVLKITKEIISSSIGNKKIITPFEDMTKAEVISSSTDKHFIKNTHSCISQAFRGHDGTCYGCVIRRLGFISAELMDTKYNYDVLSQDLKGKRSENFTSLINTCFDILFDYKNLPDFTKENIEKFSKRNLFERFSLDNFSALYTYYEKRKNKKSKYVKDLYENALKNLGKGGFEERIEQIKSNEKKPNFKKVVQ